MTQSLKATHRSENEKEHEKILVNTSADLNDSEMRDDETVLITEEYYRIQGWI